MSSYFALIVPVVSLGLKLFAQAPSPAIDPGLGSLIGNLGVVVVLAWFLYYTTTRSQPDMLSKFVAEQEKLRIEQSQERAIFEKEQDSLRATFLKEQEAQRERHERELSELRSMFIEALRDSAQTRQDMRVAVHDVKDTAQAAIVKAAVEKRKTEGS